MSQPSNPSASIGTLLGTMCKKHSRPCKLTLILPKVIHALTHPNLQGVPKVWKPLKSGQNKRGKKSTILHPTYFFTGNPMVTSDLTLNITSKLQRLKNRFFKCNPHFLLQI
uniref:Uncharacterized protein n=1 Tax=Trichogramma kaykai TaxID=54128 RepID=A0ABD2WA29_9HYME